MPAPTQYRPKVAGVRESQPNTSYNNSVKAGTTELPLEAHTYVLSAACVGLCWCSLPQPAHPRQLSPCACFQRGSSQVSNIQQQFAHSAPPRRCSQGGAPGRATQSQSAFRWQFVGGLSTFTHPPPHSLHPSRRPPRQNNLNQGSAKWHSGDREEQSRTTLHCSHSLST